MKPLIPDTLAVRTLLVMGLGLALSHALSIALYVTDRTSALTLNGGEHIGERIATIDRLISESPPRERRRLARVASDPRLLVSLGEKSAAAASAEANRHSNEFREALIAHLDSKGGRGIRIERRSGVEPKIDPQPAQKEMLDRSPQSKNVIVISLSLPDNRWLNFFVHDANSFSSWSFRFGLSMAVMLLAVAVLSALMVHNLTKPLAAFANAAQRLGVDVRAPPLPEIGPVEVRRATRAFNEMQERIRRFVEDRTQMIAAISHDLGTPITRLRLRAEFVEDDEQRRKILADLDDMETMTFSALAFARDDAAQEEQLMVDLRTLLQRVCDDAIDAGLEVSSDIGSGELPYGCRPVGLRRAIGNLINNGVKYGEKAHLSMRREANAIVITIDDRGPGIAQDRMEDVFKPFHRLEASRNRETGGTGLGLTVARTIIRAHGGDITLGNRKEGGLRVTVKLPR